MSTEKNITMKQFNGTDYDTLYPKTIASQIPDVYSKTNTITAETLSQLGLSTDKLPNDAFQQIKTLVDNAQSSADSKVKIQMGSYVGTGTYGKDNRCSLTFNFVPKVVYIIQSGRTSITNGNTIFLIESHFMHMVSGAETGIGDYAYKKNGESDENYVGGDSLVFCSFKDKTVSWYNCKIGFYESGSKAINQMNDSGTKYYWIAIG